MTLIKDIRYALRMLMRAPGFTTVAVLALALGIGANTAIFSVVDAVVLKPFPYKDPGRLMLIGENIPKLGGRFLTVPAPDTIDFQKQTSSFESVGAFHNEIYEMSGRGLPQEILAARIGATVFPLLGVNPMIGRTFTAEEDQPGRLVAILSYGLWQRSFAGDRNAIGQKVTLSRQDYTVIGVMPKQFSFPTPGIQYAEPADLWVPMALTPEEIEHRGDNFDYLVIARLKAGVTQAQAFQDVNAVAARILDLYPAQIRSQFNLTGELVPLSDVALGKVKLLAWLLLGAVALVLLIACANVANLLLARAADRQKEIAVRLALGAGRIRLLRQFMTESILLALIGGAAGLVLAGWGTGVLASLAPPTLPRADQIGMNGTVLIFTIVVSLATGIIFGTAPAFAASSVHFNDTLKEGGRGNSEGVGRRRLRAAVVISELAFATVLLVGAGLLIRSFARVRETNPGFRPQSLITMSVSLPQIAYSKGAQVQAFYTSLLDKVRAIPGTESVGFSTDLPLKSGWSKLFTPEGYTPAADAKLNMCRNSMVMGNYLGTLGVPLIHGRLFDDQDRAGAQPVVIISDSIAKQFWPNQDPIGKRLKWGPPEGVSPWMTIVGVVGDVKPGALDAETQPHTYEPYLQADSDAAPIGTDKIAIRTSSPTGVIVDSVREAVSRLDSQLAVANIKTMNQIIDTSIAPRRFNTSLLIIFAAAALLLSAVGIYGVISYSVSQRRHEIGVRMALGAESGAVIFMVLRQGMLMALIGVGIGLIGSLGLTRFLETLLYEVKPVDPITMGSVGLGLIAIACLASYVPAFRATRVDPALALRSE